MRQKNFYTALCAILLMSISSCGFINKEKDVKLSTFTPAFDENVAYGYIEDQLKLGNRIPETKPHKLCKNMIQRHFMGLGYTVKTERAIKQGGIGLLTVNNVMASYEVENPKKRILLATHYDTRYASNDSIPEPVPGANDGASGTSVLMEIANIIKKDSVDFDIDFVFFDGQDQGSDAFPKTWNLGAQKWAKSNKKTYDYGIVIDMVGAKDAQFVKEKFSSYFCEDLQNKIWSIGDRLDYDDYFPEDNTVEQLVNDHYFINNYSKSKVPTLLITDYRAKESSYFPQWHTKDDVLEHIHKPTLKVVGQTLVELLYLKEE